MYGTRAPLDAGIYCNLLYQEGIRHELLDFLGNQYNFAPGATVLALHEGEAIDRVNHSSVVLEDHELISFECHLDSS
jgi:hypothetical protein